MSDTIPGVHIDYTDDQHLDVVFDGVSIRFRRETVSYIYQNGDEWTMKHVSLLVSDAYALADRSRESVAEQNSALARKIVAKIQRLPHTSIWLLHAS